MSTISLSLDEIFDLAKKTLLANGCDDETASILSDLIMKAERDGSLSHGLFRLPAYVTGLKSGKINGKGKPEVKKISPSVIKVLGNNCLAPVVLSKGIPELVKVAKEAIVETEDDVSADRLKNAAATKKLAIFDAFEILNRIQQEENLLNGVVDQKEKTSWSGFAERRSK